MTRIRSTVLLVPLISLVLLSCVSREYISPQEVGLALQNKTVLVELTNGTSVEIHSPAIIGDRVAGVGPHGEGVEVELSSIVSVQLIRVNYAAPIWFAASLGVATALAVEAATAPPPPPPSGSSCPFIYSFDGQRWAFDAEPFGGAFCRALERTEWIPLDRAREVSGRYRLLVSNELDETQYVDEIKLLVVDHQKGVRIAADAAGRMHTLSAPQLPLRATDSSGTDLRQYITARDLVFWQSPSDGAAPPADGRDELTFEFAKPAGARTAKLEINAWTTPWGAAAARDFLSFYGDGLNDFYADMNRFGPSFRRTVSWFMNEELYLLKILVQTGDGWKERGIIYGGGPYLAKTRAYAFDVSDVPGTVVRIKLRPPHNFWMLNSVSLDFSPDQQLSVREVSAAETTAPADVLQMLGADDNSCLVLNTGSRPVELSFRAPPTADGRDRTVFVKARGYYDGHIDAHGEPRRDLINRVIEEPGFCVRFANERYAKMIAWARLATRFSE